MKKKMFGRLGAAAVALTLITTAMMSGTLAKYTTSQHGTATIKAAAWTFTAGMNNETDTVSTITLENTVDAGSKTGTIAPGSEGKFTVSMNNEDSEIEADYKVVFEKSADDTLLSKLTFTIDGKEYKTTEWTDNKLTIEGTTPLKYGKGVQGATKDIDVTWAWKDSDTDNAVQGMSTVITVTVTGTQATPTV